MNRIFFITFVTISVMLTSGVSAQQKKGYKKHFEREVFETKRNAFITAEVGLTPEEAAQFIPLCNELRQKKFELGRDCRKLNRIIQRQKEPTDADYEKVIDANLAYDIEEVQLNKEYFEKFKKILSPQKIFKYMKAERKFVRTYMKDIRSARKEKK